MKYLGFLVLAFGLVACPSTPANQTNQLLLGKVELNFSEDSTGISTQVATALADAQITFNPSPICTTAVDVIPNTRYMKCTYSFTNNGSTINNLVMYAYNQTTQSIGGTALKNMSNFNFTILNDSQTAQRFLPTHGTNANGVTETAESDLQFFTEKQASELDTSAAPAIIAVADTVLEYGFVARNTVGDSRVIPGGGTGKVTVAYKILDSDISKINATPYKFTLNFVLASETQSRIVRSPEESTIIADARATGTDEVMLVGLDSDNSNVGTTVRRGNIKIGTAPTYLLDTSKLSLWVPNSRSDSVKRLDAPFATAVAASATFDVPTVDVGVLAGSTPNSVSFDPEGNMWIARPVQSSIIRILKANLAVSPLVINKTINVDGGVVGIKYANGLVWVTLDPFGIVANRLRAYNANSEALVAEFTTGLNFPANLAFDSTGNLWVSNASSNNVVMYAKNRLGNNPDNAVPDRIISNTNLGTSGLQNSLRYPEGLVFDWQGNLWVANNIEGQVGTEAPSLVKYTPSQLAISGNPTPNATLLLDAVSPTSGQPGGLSLDPLDGNLWVNYQIASSVLAGQVRKYAISGGAFTGTSTPAASITYSNVTTYPGNGGLGFGNRP